MAIEAIKNKDGSFNFKGKSFKITEDKNKALEPFNKQVWDYGLVLYLLPDNDKREKINQQIGNANFVANNYLDEREKLYKEKKELLSVATYKKEYLPKLKEENEFLLKSDKFALENAIENIDDAFNKFYKALREYGLENFVVSIIELCPVEELDEKEIYYIDLYDTYHHGYNSTPGGQY